MTERNGSQWAIRGTPRGAHGEMLRLARCNVRANVGGNQKRLHWQTEARIAERTRSPEECTEHVGENARFDG